MSDEQQPPKKKRGRPRKHPPPDPNAPKRKRGRPKKSEQPQVETPDDVNQSAVEWAHAILWAVENVGQSKMSKQKAGSATRHALWEFGRENTKALVVNLMPKAMSILEKQDAMRVDDEVAAAEEKAVDEIDKLIKDAIEEAKEL